MSNIVFKKEILANIQDVIKKDHSYRHYNDQSILLQHLRFLPLKHKIEIIKTNLSFVNYIGEYSKEEALEFINFNPHIIQYIENQDLELCKKAVENDPNIIKYCQYQDYEMSKMAIIKNCDNLKYIDDIFKDDELVDLTISLAKDRVLFLLTPKYHDYSVLENKKRIEILVLKNTHNLIDVLNPTQELVKMAIDLKPLCLFTSIHSSHEKAFQTPENMIYALKQDPSIHSFIRNKNDGGYYTDYASALNYLESLAKEKAIIKLL